MLSCERGLIAGGFTHALHLRFDQSQSMQTFIQHPFVEKTLRKEAYNSCDSIYQVAYEVCCPLRCFLSVSCTRQSASTVFCRSYEMTSCGIFS